MAEKKTTRLIINSPYEEPTQHLLYESTDMRFHLTPGRRPAGYVVANPQSKTFNDPGVFYELPLVNQIRPRIKAWREADYPYPGATGVTKRLLAHWRDPEEQRPERRLFFCQLEAIETLIWLAEAPASQKVGLDIPGDGGPFDRLCCKMATGSGKTVVMAMLIAWQVINKVTYPQDSRFSKNIFVVSPGLTVKRRLQVLLPENPGNYYAEFNLIPRQGLGDALRQGKVLVRNWHVLQWDSEGQVVKKKGVDKRGPVSNERYVRDVLQEMAPAHNLVVINDEAHHAWRVPAESKVKGLRKEDIEQATKWVGGLDRIQRARGIRCCYDFSATPFAPSGKTSTEEALFGWIVSDFGLSDAIESGLVKTPRVAVRDDALVDPQTYRSQLYHLYMAEGVRDDLSRPAGETEALPDLVRNAYLLLGSGWRETRKLWEGHPTPPVMITVANRTETAARIAYSFEHKRIDIPELCDPERMLHIDSKVLKQAEEREEPVALAEPVDEDEGDEKEKKETQQERGERLRRQVDTVGKPGEPGAPIQNVISVGMLSEGWDARTVTHIMGLRAFSSQLLCEQVVGRGLRRRSYDVGEDGLFRAEYVDIIGVPFSFMPSEDPETGVEPGIKPITRIEPDDAKREYEITFPNIIRIEHTYRHELSLAPAKLTYLELNADTAITEAELAPILEGKPHLSSLTLLELQKLDAELRLQHIIFRTAVDIYDQMRPSWPGSKENLLAQVIGLVEQFIRSDHIYITPPLFNQDDLRRRIMLMVNMNKVVQHVFQAIRGQNTAALAPVFDDLRPIISTGDMPVWYTGKPCWPTARSHINFGVYDSAWEATEAYELDKNPNVAAWVKNDHLGFEISYIFQGARKKYRPDFLIRLTSGKLLVLEVKGQDSQGNRTKLEFLDEWVKAVNAHGGFGQWAWAASRDPEDVAGILEQAAGSRE